MALPPLKVTIGADTVGFDKAVAAMRESLGGLKTRTDKLGQELQRFGDRASGIGRKMLPVSGGIAAIGAAAAGVVKTTADAGVEISNMSRIAGTSAEEFQRLAAGARTVGIDSGKLADIYKDMNDRVGDFMATGGGPMADFFENIAPQVGVTADEFARLSGPEAMQLYVDSLEKAGASQQDMTFYMEAMAGDASALIPLLRDNGAEMTRLGDAAEKAGAVMDSKAIASSREFQEQMLTLQDSMTGATREIGQALLPVALELATAFQEKVVPAITSIVGGITNAIEWFGQLPGPVQEAATLVAGALGVGGPILMAVGVLSKALGALVVASGPIGLFIAAAGLMTAAWMKWGDEIKEIVSGAATWLKETFQSVLDFYTSLPGKMLEIGRDIIMGLWNGIKEAAAEFSPVEAIKNVGSSMLSGLRGLLRSNSPSMAFHDIGMDVGLGLRNGIVESTPLTQEAMRGLANSLVGEGGMEVDGPTIGEGDTGGVGGIGEMMAMVADQFRGYGESIGQNLASGIRSTMGLAKAAVGEMGENTKAGAFDMAQGVVSAMGQMFKGSKPIAMAQALINTFQGITEALKLPFPKSLAAAAQVAAQGFAAIKSIQSARPGSGTSGAAATGAGAGGGGGAPASLPVQQINVETQGNGPVPQSSMGNIIDQINELGRQGHLIDIRFVGSA